MKNSAVRIVSASGFVFFCLTNTATAQQSGAGYATQIVTLPDQNVPGAAYPKARPVSIYNRENTEPTPSWSIIPRVRLTETFTDNVDLSASNKQSDLITAFAPGIRITANTTRLRLNFDYELVGYLYAKNSDYSNFQNYLNTFGTLEAIDNWLFLDFSGYITQQAISPFGVQSTSNANISNNRTQTQTYRLSPYIRGQLGGDVAEYTLRYNAATTKSGNDSISDVDISQWIGQIRGSTPFQSLAWTIDGSQQTTDYSLGRDYDDDRLRGILSYQLFPQFRISGSGGEESNNYITVNKQSYTTYGYGFDWRPTERTVVAGFKEKRFFGYGHNFNVSHRFPLSSIQYTDLEDVAFIPNGYNTTGQSVLYDQYFDLFANQIPDPIARASYVTNLLNQSGTAANATNTQAVNGYLTNRPQLRRTQQLALILFGSRNAVTFRGTRVSDEVLWIVGGGAQDPINPYSKVIQNGYSLSFTHRLTPKTSLNLLGAYQTNDAPSSPSLDNTLRTLQVGVLSQLGMKTYATLNVRRSIYSSDSSPYNENAINISLIYSF